jgi:serine protease Do
MNYDIAVLKVTDSTVLMESNAMAVTVANSDEVTILDTAIAIGNPEDSGISATVGNINVDSEHIYVRFETASGNQAVELRVMRTDAAVNSGNSGGGLFNDRGELIGIVNAKDADESVDNIGYAIPSNVAKAIADNAIHYSDGTVKRCLLGITVGVKSYKTNYDINTGKIYKLEEVVVTEITSTAAAKGILEVGDVINSITVDGVRCEVSRIHHVVDSMLYARVGSSVTINVTRGGVKADLTLPITESMLTVY